MILRIMTSILQIEGWYNAGSPVGFAEGQGHRARSVNTNDIRFDPKENTEAYHEETLIQFQFI